MSSMSDFLEQELVDHFASDSQLALENTFVALFTDIVNDAGTGTEVTGGAYARIIVNQDGATGTFWADNGSSMDNTGDITFPQASAAWGRIKSVGIMDALTTGNLLFRGVLGSAPKVFVGTAVDDRINSPAHGRVVDDLIVFMVLEGGAGLPTGIVEGTEYFLINPTTDDFQISTSQGGGAVNLTTDGNGILFLSSQKQVDLNDTFKFASGDLDITFR